MICSSSSYIDIAALVIKQVVSADTRVALVTSLDCPPLSVTSDYIQGLALDWLILSTTPQGLCSSFVKDVKTLCH